MPPQTCLTQECACTKEWNVTCQSARTHTHMPACVRAYMDKHTHFNAWTHICTHSYSGTQTPCLSLQTFASAWATPTLSGVQAGHVAVALHSMALRRWKQHERPRTHRHPSSPLTRCTERGESAMKDLPADWGGLLYKPSGGRWLEAKSREGIPGRIPECLKCDSVFREEI